MPSDTLHEAIHTVLRDGPLLPREIAARINEHRLWVRPSDGHPVEAKQISARVRSRAYSGQFSIHDDYRVSSNWKVANASDLYECQAQLRAAIGQAVLSAAALEHTLRLVILHVRGERDGVDEHLVDDLLRLSNKPGGRLLQHLQSLNIDPDLATRVGAVIRRRNRLVHHPAEDEVLIQGLIGRSVNAAIAQVEQIAADCDAIVAELQPTAAVGVLDLVGLTPTAFEGWFRSGDFGVIDDDRLRSTLAMLHSVFYE